MRIKNYRDHQIELLSELTESGEWVAQAMIVINDAGKAKRIPIFGRRRATFDSKRGADAYALELAKLWVDGRLWGGNGRG
ncbi:MAG TPA: hypothetical protein VFK25_04865 [Candidatus Binatia bacterium]|jgi:hypothetical protein|nr:hypothetical protein [Candidatus Binatia bacterium]